MMKRILFVCLLLNISNIFSAEDVSPVTVSPNSSSPDIETKTSTTSSENRKNLTFQGTIDLIGWQYIAAGTTTLSAGYFINPENILLVNYYNLNRERENTSADKLRAVSVGLRHFVGNSFNYTPNIYYRRSTSDLYIEGSRTVITGPNIKYEDVGVGINIGNEWQWENFTMGCDWFGINTTVIKLNDEAIATGPTDERNRHRGLTLNLLHFYIGVAF